MSGLQAWLSASVRSELRNRGLTQADLAATLGISQKHLSQILTGRAQGTLAMWDRILVAAGCRLPETIVSQIKET